jgi:phage baseplate assembly protein gpV
MSIGIVSDNNDPDGLNRIRVSMVGLQGSPVSGWVPFHTPSAGYETGISILPALDTAVILVALDRHKTTMIALAFPYTEKHKPPISGVSEQAELNQDGKNSLRVIKSLLGYQIAIDDSEGRDAFYVLSPDGKTSITFTGKDHHLSMETDKQFSAHAKGKIMLRAEEVAIDAQETLNVSAETVQITSEKQMENSSDKDISAKGSKINCN